MSYMINPHRLLAGAIAQPWPGSITDLDFAAQTYYFNGAMRTTAEFTSYTLGGATFVAQGLQFVAANTPVITVPAGSIQPGCIGIAIYNNAVPAGVNVALQLDDGTTANRVAFQQQATANLRCLVVSGGTNQLTTSFVASATGTKYGLAQSWDATGPSFKCSRDGTALTETTTGTLPGAPTLLRIGKGTTAGCAETIIARVIVMSGSKTQAEINALASDLKNRTS